MSDNFLGLGLVDMFLIRFGLDQEHLWGQFKLFFLDNLQEWTMKTRDKRLQELSQILIKRGYPVDDEETRDERLQELRQIPIKQGYPEKIIQIGW